MDNNGKKLLIVEDDQFLREFYQELLQGEGYIVDVAGDGEIAFQKITNNKYDLILLDIMLPKKDGLQILTELKAGQKMGGLKIVALTNLGQDSVIKECFDLGVAGYMIKSALNPDQVLSEIKTYLSGSSTRSANG